MSANIDADNIPKKTKDIFINANSDKKSIKSIWINKEGTGTKIFCKNNKEIRFVSVGNSGKSHYSLDGITWQPIDGLNPSFNFTSVTYGSGRFVCVGTSGRSYYNDKESEYGNTWRSMFLSNIDGNDMNSVTYGNGMFVCVGNNGKSFYLKGKETIWTPMTGLPSFINPKIVIFNNGKFYCTGSNIMYSSSDGKTWSGETINISINPKGMAYGNGKFVCVRESSMSYYSTDGKTFTPLVIPSKYTYDIFYSVIYGKDRFVTVGHYGAFYNLNNSWIRMTGLPEEYFENPTLSGTTYSSVTYGNKIFICVSSKHKIAHYSLDGITWKAMGGLSAPMRSVAYSSEGGHDSF